MESVCVMCILHLDTAKAANPSVSGVFTMCKACDRLYRGDLSHGRETVSFRVIKACVLVCCPCVCSS